MLKNITFSAEQRLIQKARIKAQKESRSLNQVFRELLQNYAEPEQNDFDYEKFVKNLNINFKGKKFTREEMNER